MQFLTLFVFAFEYFTLFEYIRIVSVFTNSIRYSYSFQIAKRILFGIRIRSKITIRPNTGNNYNITRHQEKPGNSSAILSNSPSFFLRYSTNSLNTRLLSVLLVTINPEHCWRHSDVLTLILETQSRCSAVVHRGNWRIWR